MIWLNTYAINQTYVLPGQCSDHNPLLIVWVNPNQEAIPKQKICRYEVAWEKREGCSDLVQAVWKQNFPARMKITAVRKVMDLCRNKLKSWSKEAFRNHKRLLN